MADQTATTEDLLSHLPALLDRLRSRSAGSSPSTSSSGPSSALLAQLGLLSGHGREAGEGGGGKENGDGQSLSANARDVREALTERFLTPKMGLEEKWLGKYQV